MAPLGMPVVPMTTQQNATPGLDPAATGAGCIVRANSSLPRLPFERRSAAFPVLAGHVLAASRKLLARAEKMVAI